MDRRAADRGDVVERLLENLGELALAPRRGAGPALPAVRARLGVEPELGEAVAGELGAHVGGRVVIRHLQLDRLEAGRRCRAEALHERALDEQVGEIGGETGHGRSLAGSQMRSAAAGPPYCSIPEGWMPACM